MAESVDVQRLVAVLEARLDKYEKGLARAVSQGDRSFARIEQRGKQMESRMSALGANIGNQLRASLAGLATIQGLRGLQDLIDTSVRIDNALKVAGLSGEGLKQVYDQLFAAAQKNAAPLETLVELYSRATQVQRELGVSSQQIISFTGHVAEALRVSGQSAEQSSGALLQLAQALGSGTVHAQEFNSILENALPIAQAAAAGLEEAGGSVARLRQLVIDGKVSSAAFFAAFEAGASVLDQKVAGAELTVSQSFIRLQNVLIDAAGRFNEVSGASEGAARLLDHLAGVVEGLSNVFDKAASGPVGNFIGRLSQLNDLLLKVLPGINVLGLVNKENLDRVAGVLGGSGETGTGQGDIQTRIDQAFGNQATAGKSDRLAPPPSPVSLADYPVTSTGGGRAAARGAGSADAYQSELRQVRDRTAAITAQTAAQAGLNPLIDDYGYALEKARTVADLLAAAEKAHMTVTPALRADIDALAESYAQASATAQQLSDSQDRARQTAEDLRNTAKDVVGGFVQDLIQGKSAADALSDALGKIADKLLNLALDSLFSTGGGRTGGLLGGTIIPGILHSGGVAGSDGYGHGRSVSPAMFAGAPRYHAGGVAGLRPGEVPAILQRGEIVLPNGSAGGGNGPLVEVQVINNSSNSQVRQDSTRGANGRELRRIYIDDIKQEMAQGGFDRVMAGRFRVQPQQVSR